MGRTRRMSVEYLCAGAEILGELASHAGGRGEPECAAVQAVLFRKLLRELARERVHDEARIARGQVASDVGILFLVAGHRAHGRQAARDGVRAAGNALAEWKWNKGGHGGRKVSVAQARRFWQQEGWAGEKQLHFC